ncbi:tyrosine-type recombinase/integrase [Streptomyces mirabilis]|uniref:tyrosine-type recombinase/integrase n=1 Tax=Streptomyces mirabilis TaxID=68239 RepID=UPI0034105921
MTGSGLPRRFDPQRALALPRSINAPIGPRSRVIANDVWAKLLWAGLNLEAHDVPRGKAGPIYPVELVRAVTLTWLFSGQRSNEIARLRLGCVRWQHDGDPVAASSTQILARDAVCLLDVPAHKTGTAFAKPVDPLLGQAINAWQALRPSQPKRTDKRTGEQVDFLFSYRARTISSSYINSSIIPILCRKAGVPTVDARGSITSHRARSTIASQLHNAKEPMTLFELQAWLGHRSLESHPALREDQPQHTDQGVRGRRIRRPQRTHHRGPRRPRGRHIRRRRSRGTMAALRPGARLLHVHVLRAVPAPHGLCPLRLLHAQGVQQGPAPGGE